MNLNSPILLIEINKLEFIFGVGELDESSGFKLLYNQILIFSIVLGLSIEESKASPSVSTEYNQLLNG